MSPGPIVGRGGTIYAASNAGVLHALNPATGVDKWTYDSGHTGGGDLSVSPLILPDGTIIWPTPGPQLLALSPTGALLWPLILPGNPTSPASADDKRIYIGDASGAVTAVDVAAGTRSRAWTVQAGASSYARWSPPATAGCTPRPVPRWWQSMTTAAAPQSLGAATRPTTSPKSPRVKCRARDHLPGAVRQRSWLEPRSDQVIAHGSDAAETAPQR